MTNSRWFAWACALSVLACGSGGGPGTDSSEFYPESPESNEHQASDFFGSPPRSYGEVPNGTQQAAPNPFQPPGDTGGGVVSGGSCAEICDGLQAGGCEIGQRSTCAAECNSGLAAFGECVDELITLYMCIIEHPSFACVEGEFEDDQFLQLCPNEGYAFAVCADLSEPDPDPDPDPTNMCTVEQGCNCGNDICATCLCAFGGDQASCVDYCG